MKRILTSLAMIAVVAVVGVGATRAFFSDSVTSSGNTFSAGTMELDVNGTHSLTTPLINISNIKPGDNSVTLGTTVSFPVKNNGTVNGFLNLVGNTVSVTQGTGAGHISNGHSLGDLLTVTIKAGTTTLYSGTLSGLTTATMADFSLAAGASTTVTVDWNWTSNLGTIDNGAQGDSALVGLGFNLSQNSL